MKLVTFPGQGSAIKSNSLKRWCQSFKTFQIRETESFEILECVKANLSNSGSIAVCSNLLYLQWKANNKCTDAMVTLGHSLGELNAFNAGVENELFTTKDIFEIANKRHELMKTATQRYLNFIKATPDQKFGLWAIVSPRSKNLREELILSESLRLANHNSVNQCVLTGFQQDLNLLKLPRNAKITRLLNKDCIPFHNDSVLHEIQEPLYDFIASKLRGRLESRLDRQVISVFDGSKTDRVDQALCQFVLSSTNTVEFVKCLEKAKEIGVTTTTNIGPGGMVNNLISRAMPSLKTNESFGE